MHAEAFQRPGPGRDEGLGRAVAWAVALHLGLLAVLLLSPLLTWDPDRISVAGAPSIDAVLEVSDADRQAAVEALRAEPVPLPEPEPAPVDQEEVRRDAEAERARVEREQEERGRQEQIDLTERERQREAEEKRRLAQQQLEKIRAERERLEREQRLAQQRLEQIAARERQAAQPPATPAGPPPPGNQGVDTGLAARYAAAIQEAILRNWTRPDTVPIGQRCRIVIRQIPGGEVVSAEVDPSCPYDELGRRSVEAAVLKAQPLPYAGFEAVFQRTLTLNFQAQDR